MTRPNIANNEASAVGCTRFKKMRPVSPQGETQGASLVYM